MTVWALHILLHILPINIRDVVVLLVHGYPEFYLRQESVGHPI